jgi:hypothetical protein
MSNSLSKRSGGLLASRYLGIALAIMIVVVGLGGFVGVPDAGAVSDPIQRGIGWDAARDKALAAFYEAQADADIAQAAGWDVARDRALAAFYGAQADAGIAQVAGWDAARDRALAAFYGAQADAGIAQAAGWDAVRDGALAAFYGAQVNGDIQRGIDASAARYQALGEFYQTGAGAVYLAQGGGDVLAANPELMVARRYMGSVPLDSSFLAANPELMVTRRYMGSVLSDFGLLAANPELTLARRYSPAPVVGSCSSEGLGLAYDPEFAALRQSC